MYEVYNHTTGYVEHVGTRGSCIRWVENVYGLFGTGDTFEVREQKRRKSGAR